MTKDEALKMAYKAEETGNLQDLIDAVNALIEALEQPACPECGGNGAGVEHEEDCSKLQPAQNITEGATMFKQVGNSPKPSPPPPIHTCTYSRTMNQEYPRKCVHCGKVEALDTKQVCENAAPAQEPVAWMTKWENQDGEIKYAVYEEKIGKFDIPLYTHPHQWQGLTDDEIEKVFESIETSTTHRKIYHAIEQALKEKNVRG